MMNIVAQPINKSNSTLCPLSSTLSFSLLSNNLSPQQCVVEPASKRSIEVYGPTTPLNGTIRLEPKVFSGDRTGGVLWLPDLETALVTDIRGTEGVFTRESDQEEGTGGAVRGTSTGPAKRVRGGPAPHSSEMTTGVRSTNDVIIDRGVGDKGSCQGGNTQSGGMEPYPSPAPLTTPAADVMGCVGSHPGRLENMWAERSVGENDKMHLVPAKLKGSTVAEPVSCVVQGGPHNEKLTLPFVTAWARKVERNHLTSTYNPLVTAEFDNLRPSTFRVDVFEALTRTCPFVNSVSMVCGGFRFGFDTGYRFVEKSVGVADSFREFPNRVASAEEAKAISKTIANDFTNGYIGGGTEYPPFTDSVVSPIKAIPKKECTVPTGEFRLVHNLSRGSDEFYSVNGCISEEDSSVHYSNIEDAIRMIQRMGRGCRLSKIDIKSAYRLLCVKKELWRTMMYKWDGKYYFETRLPFGLRSAPCIFEMFSSMLHWILVDRAEVVDLVHYLDDFLVGGRPHSEECLERTELVLALFNLLGVPVNAGKLVKSVTNIVFLGIGIDTERGIAFVPPERLKAMKSLIREWELKKSCTQEELLSLIGVLQFAARVVKPGRTFLRRMIDVAYSVSSKIHHIRIEGNWSFKGDLDWWSRYLDRWNGESLFYEEYTPLYIHGLGLVSPVSNDELQLFTDASKRGAGGICGSSWFQFEWTEEESRYFGIDYRELYALTTAVLTFVEVLRGKTIVVRCDNMAAVEALNGGSVRNRNLMHLIRELHFCAADNVFHIICQHVDGIKNTIADSLSRFQMDVFRKLAPMARLEPVEAVRPRHPDGWLDFQKSKLTI